MRVILTNLSDRVYEQSRLLLNRSARKYGVQEIHSYDFDEIKISEFYRDNTDILNCSKGIGYWLWKPYIVLEAMQKIEENDIVIYCDSGVEIIAPIEALLSICKDCAPVLLFGNGNHINAQWTKRDCFVLMNCDKPRFWYASHCDAAFALFRKNSFSLNFLHEWLKFGSNKNIISDVPNICGLDNLPEYQEHRWDQSILSLLAEKYEISLFRMPSQFGNHYKIHNIRKEDEFNCINQSEQKQLKYYHFLPYLNSPYPQLLNHHRSKANDGNNEGNVVHVPSLSKGKVKRWMMLKKYLKKLVNFVWSQRNFFILTNRSFL